MTGGLIGKWKTTSFKTLATSPIYKGKGTEKFNGCLDRRRDGHCAGDPRGTIRFSFLYWAKFGPGDSLVWGSCWHPVRGGTGGFRSDGSADLRRRSGREGRQDPLHRQPDARREPPRARRGAPGDRVRQPRLRAGGRRRVRAR